MIINHLFSGVIDVSRGSHISVIGNLFAVTTGETRLNRTAKVSLLVNTNRQISIDLSA